LLRPGNPCLTSVFVRHHRPNKSSEPLSCLHAFFFHCLREGFFRWLSVHRFFFEGFPLARASCFRFLLPLSRSFHAGFATVPPRFFSLFLFSKIDPFGPPGPACLFIPPTSTFVPGFFRFFHTIFFAGELRGYSYPDLPRLSDPTAPLRFWV